MNNSKVIESRKAYTIVSVDNPHVTDVGNPNHWHMVWWKGEGWYVMETDGEWADDGEFVSWTRWFLATEQEKRENICEYLTTPSGVVLPDVFDGTASGVVHVSPREDDNPLAALEAEWTEIDEWVKGLDFSDL